MFGRRRRIAKWINTLLDGSYIADMALESFGESAWPSLLAAINDPRAMSAPLPPVSRICGLLWRHQPDELAEALISNWARIPDIAVTDVTRTLSLIGTERSIGFVCAMHASSGEPRRAAIMSGIKQRLHQNWRTLQGSLRPLYDLVLPTLNGKHKYEFQNVAIALLISDSERAISLLTQQSIFNLESEDLGSALAALHEARVSIPAQGLIPIVSELTERLRDSSVSLPARQISMYALPVLARSLPAMAGKIVEEWQQLSRGDRWGIAETIAILNQVEDARQVVMQSVFEVTPNREIRDHFHDIAIERQNYYAAFEVDAQVCNGGFRQFFSNPSGRCAMHAPGALQAIGAPRKAELMRQALDAVGLDRIAQAPGGRPNIEDSLTLDKLGVLDDLYYTDGRNPEGEHVLDLLKVYAAKHAEHFQLK